MKQLVTSGIVLRRTDYGEADRIINVLTPDYGKIGLVAKGVRRSKSKLAGGIELFSVSHFTFIKGRSDLGTLISSRLEKHYGSIVKDIGRTMLGYDLIAQLNRATEDNAEADYFELLQQAFEALDDPAIGQPLLRCWFAMQLLRLSGSTPNLQTDTLGNKLVADGRYEFSIDDMSFTVGPLGGPFTAAHIKFLRLGFAGYPARVLGQVQGGEALLEAVAPLVQVMLTAHVRV